MFQGGPAGIGGARRARLLYGGLSGPQVTLVPLVTHVSLVTLITLPGPQAPGSQGRCEGVLLQIWLRLAVRLFLPLDSAGHRYVVFVIVARVKNFSLDTTGILLVLV